MALLLVLRYHCRLTFVQDPGSLLRFSGRGWGCLAPLSRAACLCHSPSFAFCVELPCTRLRRGQVLGVTCAEESFCEAILRLAGGDGARDSPSLWDDRPSQILIGPVAHPFSFARVTFIILLSAWVLVGAHGGLLCAVGAMFGVAVTPSHCLELFRAFAAKFFQSLLCG